MPVLFMEELPDVTLDDWGARLCYESAGELYIRRYPRGLWRRFLEREIRRLNKHETAERGGIVPIRGAGG